MHVERVQRWVMSALLLTTALIFAGGLALLAAEADNGASARPGLLVLAGVVGVAAVAGVRALHEESLLTGWLVAGLVPAAVGWYLLYLA